MSLRAIFISFPTFVSREELMKQYTIGAVSGELPDIGMVDSPDMASYISLGVFEDITDYLNDWPDLEQFYPGPMASAKGCRRKNLRTSEQLQLSCTSLAQDILKAAGVENPPTILGRVKRGM